MLTDPCTVLVSSAPKRLLTRGLPLSRGPHIRVSLGPRAWCAVRHRGGARRLVVARGQHVRPRTPKRAAWWTAKLVQTAARARAQPRPPVSGTSARLPNRQHGSNRGADALVPLGGDPRARPPRLGVATTRGAACNSCSSRAAARRKLRASLWPEPLRASPCIVSGGMHVLQRQAPPLHGVSPCCTVQFPRATRKARGLRPEDQGAGPASRRPRQRGLRLR